MTSTPSPASFARSTSVLTRLHTEWHHLTIRASELEAVHSWGLPGESVNSLDEVLERCGYRHHTITARASHPTGAACDDTAGDEYLLRVVDRARHDSLAARIVLQRILPALCALARRHATSPQRRLDLVDELIANAWPIIRTYPVERRPRRVAVNLVRDIGFQTVVRPQRRRSATAELTTAQHRLPDTAEIVAVDPLHELVDLLREAREVGAVSDGDVDFICQLVNHRRPEQLAATLDVTPRTVRNHRDAVVHRLRGAALAAA
jgi:DNA-directed RNA polymerase specialized sigma24 family protein